MISCVAFEAICARLRAQQGVHWDVLLTATPNPICVAVHAGCQHFAEGSLGTARGPCEGADSWEAIINH